METARNLVRAKLIPIKWNENEEVELLEQDENVSTVEVQFNPSTLKVTYANQIQTGGESTGSSMQFVGKGTSKLAIELIFDVSGPRSQNVKDVRQLTRAVAVFMSPVPEGSGDDTRYRVPGVRFEWGTFTFDGVIEGMDETLELFSEDGYPLRATVSLNMSYQGISLADKSTARNNAATPSPGSGSPTGTKPLTPAKAGDTLQGMVAAGASASAGANWKAVAAANGIENPRQISTGTLLDMSASAKVSASASISANTNLFDS